MHLSTLLVLGVGLKAAALTEELETPLNVHRRARACLHFPALQVLVVGLKVASLTEELKTPLNVQRGMPPGRLPPCVARSQVQHRWETAKFGSLPGQVAQAGG